MGWSCSTIAGATADAWMDACKANSSFTNVWGEADGGRFMYEISNVEHLDGAITGRVLRLTPDGYSRPAGGFRIEPDGRVSRGRRWLKKAAEGATRRFPANAQPGSGGPR